MDGQEAIVENVEMKKLLFKLGRFLINRYIRDFSRIATPRMIGCKCHIEKRACLLHSSLDFEYPANLKDEIDRDYFRQWIEYVRQLPSGEIPPDREFVFVSYMGELLFAVDQDHASSRHVREFMRDLNASGRFTAPIGREAYEIFKISRPPMADPITLHLDLECDVCGKMRKVAVFPVLEDEENGLDYRLQICKRCLGDVGERINE